MLERGDGGWRGIGVSGSGYNEVLALEVRNVVSTEGRCGQEMWFDCVEQKRHAKLPLFTTAPRAFAAALSFQVCLRAFICTVKAYRHVYVYIYACVHVFVHLCVYTHVYVYVYAYLCIDYGSQYQCFSVWTVSCMRVCVRVRMYA